MRDTQGRELLPHCKTAISVGKELRTDVPAQTIRYTVRYTYRSWQNNRSALAACRYIDSGFGRTCTTSATPYPPNHSTRGPSVPPHPLMLSMRIRDGHSAASLSSAVHRNSRRGSSSTSCGSRTGCGSLLPPPGADDAPPPLPQVPRRVSCALHSLHTPIPVQRRWR